MRQLLLLSLLWPVALPALPAQDTVQSDRLQVADLLDFEDVADPRISPDGSRIVYTRRWVNRIEDRRESALWIMNADGSRNRFLVKGSNARWSPDGTRILYLAGGEPRGTQIFVRWMDAEGATSQVTRVTESPRNPRWSPDGRSVAFAMTVPAAEEWSIDMPRAPRGATWTEGPRIIDRLHYRQDRVGFTEPGYTHLFVVPAVGGTPRQLTRGEWNVGARFDGLTTGVPFDWSPDGRTIVFDGLREDDGDLVYRRSHIHSVDVASGEIRTLTSEPGFWTAPRFSPDGSRIAFTGEPATEDTYAAGRLYVMARDGSGRRSVLGDFDREPGAVRWDPAGRGVYFTAQDRGSVNVFFASVQGGVRPVTSGVQVLSLSDLAGEPTRAVGTRTDPDEPDDVVIIDLASGAMERLTDVNADVLHGKTLGAVEEIRYPSSGDAEIQGWLVTPPDFDSTRQYPLILEIHGGPFAMYTVGFSFNFQAFAAHDYVVLYTNPRGSTGYGEAFSKAIDFRYPGVDYDDLMAGVDAAVARGFVDTTHMYVGGCSGGGVLSSWVIGHTDRFAAAAVRCPVTNWISMAGQTDVPQFTHSFFHEPFWENPTRWLEQSSVMYAGTITTPTIIMTGEQDLRTPMPQSEELFAALKMRGIPAKLLRFREEFHGTGSKPSNAMRTLLYMMSWYEQHRREPAGAQAGAGAAP